MKYIPKTLKFSITIPNTEAGATDYVQIFSNGGSGDTVTTVQSPKLKGVLSGTNYVFTYKMIVSQPAVWKFKYTLYDAIGNAGTSSAEATQDLTDMAPAKPASLKLAGYDADLKVLTWRT